MLIRPQIRKEGTDVGSSDFDLEDILTECAKANFHVVRIHSDSHSNVGLE